MSPAQDSTSRPQVAYLGPIASFSHQAALEYFHDTADLHPYASFSSIFNALQHGSSQITHAIVPIENSSNGTVVSLLDLLADPESKYPDIRVCAEYYLNVHHCLLVMPTSTSAANTSQVLEQEPIDPGVRNIKTLHTHPQVWTQCTNFLSKHLSHAERIDTSSTSAAAGYLNTPSSAPTDAAIGSSLAAQTFSLRILASNIEDEANNTTRFLVLTNTHNDMETPPLPQPQVPTPQRKKKSLVTFTLNHDLPGTLADALQIFAQHGYNLTSIDTRPSRQRPWHYIFCVECEESGGDAARQNGESFSLLLASLRRTTERCRYLGTWGDALGTT